MAKPPGLRKRGGSWEVRVRVPERLKGILKRGEVVRSLGGVSTSEAHRAAWFALAAIRADFEQAEIASGARPVAVTSSSAAPASRASDEELTRFAKACLQELESNPAAVPLEERRQQDMLAGFLEEAVWLASTNPSEDATFQSIASRIAGQLGLNIAPADGERFDEALRAAWLEHINRQKCRLEGRASSGGNPAFADVQGTSASTPSMTLGEAITMYKARPSRGALTEATHKNTAFRLRALEELLGAERRLSDIGRVDMRRYVSDLQAVPARAPQRFRNMSLQEAIREAEGQATPRLSAKSVKLYAEAASSLFKWLHEEHLIDRNPAVRLDTPVVPSKSERRPFTASELNNLLRATSKKSRAGAGWAYWAIRILLLHGLRLTEPLGLLVKDIEEIDGQWTIRLRPNDQRRLKTAETERVLPLHPKLVRLGLPELIKGRNPDDLLFADVPRGKSGSLNAAQKRLGRLVDNEVGDDATVVIHSLRHNFRDAQRAAGIPQDVAAALGGWKLPSVGASSAMEGYGAGFPLRQLASWIEKIDYPGVHLD